MNAGWAVLDSSGASPACVSFVGGGVVIGDVAMKPEMLDDASVHGDFGAIAL